jgi:hypothetical protein
LLLVATHWAHSRPYGELALNAPAPALGLIQFFVSQGFRVVEQAQLPSVTQADSPKAEKANYFDVGVVCIHSHLFRFSTADGPFSCSGRPNSTQLMSIGSAVSVR